jgi:hypothetical protein
MKWNPIKIAPLIASKQAARSLVEFAPPFAVISDPKEVLDTSHIRPSTHSIAGECGQAARAAWERQWITTWPLLTSAPYLITG